MGHRAKKPCLRCRRGGGLGAAGNAFTVLLALAGAATAAWALAESLHATDGKATEFWGIITDARARVRSARPCCCLAFQPQEAAMQDPGCLEACLFLRNSSEHHASWKSWAWVPVVLARHLTAAPGQLCSGP